MQVGTVAPPPLLERLELRKQQIIQMFELMARRVGPNDPWREKKLAAFIKRRDCQLRSIERHIQRRKEIDAKNKLQNEANAVESPTTGG